MTVAQTSPTARWAYPQTISMRMIFIIAAIVLVLGITGDRVEIGRLFVGSSDRTSGIVGLSLRFFPPQLDERRPVETIADFDAADPPLFSHVEQVASVADRIDPKTMAVVRTRTTQSVLVEPLGYAAHVAVKIIETFEIALWGTVLALAIGLPLALLGARSAITPPVVGGAFRAVTSVFRALPELISALLLVAVYGFGPVAGVLALGVHGAGFLGKFFAEEIENTDKRPQEALAAIGASRLVVWRLAVLPQVLPPYVGYTFYILDRNVRMATVIGLVGAGGIGQELKGRFDMYEYPRVGTILIAIFIVVLLLDMVSARLRRAVA
jgi:phosphonate transport system permease protein